MAASFKRGQQCAFGGYRGARVRMIERDQNRRHAFVVHAGLYRDGALPRRGDPIGWVHERDNALAESEATQAGRREQRCIDFAGVELS